VVLVKKECRGNEKKVKELENAEEVE